MKQQQVVQFIVDRLDQELSASEIARKLCEQTGWPPQQVRAFVSKIEAEYRASMPAPPSDSDIQLEPEVVDRSRTPAVSPTPSARAGAVKSQRPETASPHMMTQHARSRRPVSPLEEHPEITDFVIAELGGHGHREAIVRTVCERTGWPWREAHSFVQRVEIEHHGQITARQSPLLIFLGIGIILVGVIMSASTGLMIMNGQVIDMLGAPVPYLENLIYFFIGVGMIVGGLAGIWRTLTLMRE